MQRMAYPNSSSQYPFNPSEWISAQRLAVNRDERPATRSAQRHPQAAELSPGTPIYPPAFLPAPIYSVVTATLVPPRTTPSEDKRRKIRLAEGSKAIAPVAWANTA
jgi:hypothetical protein